MKKPGIPVAPRDPGRGRFDIAVKETLETITGERGARIVKLSANASLSDVIAKVNEILDTLQ